jgi:siderophore synthetase component
VIYRDELLQGIVVPVENVSIPSGATTSFRTLVPRNRENSGKFAVKASVNSQMTSTIRSISANTTQNGPKLSEIILKVLQREPELSTTFVPVCELAGANFRGRPPEDNELWNAKSRNLSVVLRENVNLHVGPEELAIVGSSLYSESPLTKKPILIELIESYSDLIGEKSLPRAALWFVSEYAAISLPGFLTLMVKYGIGLEGHLQNSVPIFKQGRPVRMLFRDWGGLRIYTQRLEQQKLMAHLVPDSVTTADNVEEMRNKVFYTVFQNHLSEIVFQTCKHLAVRERELWEEIYQISEGVFERLMSDPEQVENAISDRTALYKAEMDHKALTKMRLEERKGDCYVALPNPLHQFSELWIAEEERSHDTLEL